jgi:hypothetical protein
MDELMGIDFKYLLLLNHLNYIYDFLISIKPIDAIL